MVFIKQEDLDEEDFEYGIKDRVSLLGINEAEMDISDADVKPEDSASLNGEEQYESDSDRIYTLSLAEEAIAWDGEDMQHLENTFGLLRNYFHYMEPGTSTQDLQAACCHFLEQPDKLPLLHRAQANLMMVVLIDTEYESTVYAEQAQGIVEELERACAMMFGLRDERIKELRRELRRAWEETARRIQEGCGDEMEESGEGSDDEECSDEIEEVGEESGEESRQEDGDGSGEEDEDEE